MAAAFLVFQAVAAALADSQDNDWGPARALLHGFDPFKLYLDCGYCAKPPFNPPVAPMYPASGLVLLWPLAMLPWPVAKVIWAGLNILLGAGLTVTLYRLFLPHSGWRAFAVALGALFAGTPFLNNLGNGQHAIFALAFFPAALWVERRGNSWLAAAFLAASWFKYTLTLPLSLFFLVRGRFAPLIGAVAIHAVLSLFAAVWTGSSPLDLLLGPLRVAQTVTSVGHLELFGLATRLGLVSKIVPLAAALVLTAAVLAAAVQSRAEDDLQLLTLLSLFAYAVIYHFPYDLVILVIPLFYVLSRVKSWNDRGLPERIWAVMLAILLGWTWFADHLIQVMMTRQVVWMMHAYPVYYAALAIWFYATTITGILVVARTRRQTGSAVAAPAGRSTSAL